MSDFDRPTGVQLLQTFFAAQWAAMFAELNKMTTFRQEFISIAGHHEQPVIVRRTRAHVLGLHSATARSRRSSGSILSYVGASR